MENITETAQQNEKKEINIEEENLAIAPGKMRVIKRNGSVVSYEAEKIAIAITKAFLAVEGGAAAASTRIHNQVNEYFPKENALRRNSTHRRDTRSGRARTYALWGAESSKNLCPL